jgi:peroxiredoxin Q/BCP
MLEIGAQIPNVSGLSQDNVIIDLPTFVGKPLVVYFYPKDNTPGCTTQACSIRDGYSLLQEKGIQIIGISADSVVSHQKFATKFSLPFPLLADTEKNIINAFGVWGPKKFMGKEYDGIFRTTFLFDENGLLKEVLTKPNTKSHAEEILAFYDKN